MIKINWKYEIGQRVVEYDNENNIIKDITIIDRKVEIENKKDNRKEKGYTVNNIKYYKYKCNICEFSCKNHYKNGEFKEEYWIKESLINYSNCLFCTGQIVIKDKNDVATTHPYLIKYFANIEDVYRYSYGSHSEKVCMKCPDCGFEKEMYISTLTTYGFSCKKCGDGVSYPNKFAFNMLEQLNIDFETEYNPKWCKYLSKNKSRQGYYDFYFKLNGKKYIIEMDGGFHENDNSMSGSTKEESKYIDNEKDMLAIEHDIEKPIRIDCNYDSIEYRFEYVKQNVLDNKKLNKLFDLNKIDWNKCNEFACENLIKDVCKMRNEKLYNTINLAKKFKLSQATVIKYLKIGNSLNWCTYDATVERDKSIKEVGKLNGKSIKCMENNQIFESATDCAKQSLKVFGVKMTRSLINQVCNGLRNHHHGYHFCFV